MTDILRNLISLIFIFLFTNKVCVVFHFVFWIDHIERLFSDDKAVLQLRQVPFRIIYYEFIFFCIFRNKFDVSFIFKDLKSNFRLARQLIKHSRCLLDLTIIDLVLLILFRNDLGCYKACITLIHDNTTHRDVKGVH